MDKKFCTHLCAFSITIYFKLIFFSWNIVQCWILFIRKCFILYFFYLPILLENVKPNLEFNNSSVKYEKSSRTYSMIILKSFNII